MPFLEPKKSLYQNGIPFILGLCLLHRDSVLHRIVKGGWVQGGDIIEGAGDDGCSIYGETFPDESFSVKFSDEGIVVSSLSFQTFVLFFSNSKSFLYLIFLEVKIEK